jgi:hypothetical protein
VGFDSRRLVLSEALAELRELRGELDSRYGAGYIPAVLSVRDSHELYEMTERVRLAMQSLKDAGD